MYKFVLLCLFWGVLVAFPEKVCASSQEGSSCDIMLTLFEELGLNLDENQNSVSENKEPQEELASSVQDKEDEEKKHAENISDNQSESVVNELEEPATEELALEDNSRVDVTEDGVERTRKRDTIKQQIKEDAKDNIEKETTPEIEPEDKEVTDASSAIQKGRLKEAYKTLIKNLEKKPCDSKTLGGLLKIAEVWQYQKKFRKKALHIYLIYHKCKPDNSDILLYLGRLYSWMGKNQDAERALKKVLEITP